MTKSYYILSPFAVEMFSSGFSVLSKRGRSLRPGLSLLPLRAGCQLHGCCFVHIMRRVSEKTSMIARYAGGERGARAAARAGSAVVVVDAFRASTTIAVLVKKGARVVPVASIGEARSYAGADLRAGERGSAMVAGFDFGNSPTEILESDVPVGSTVVLSTTNGTRVVEAARGAPAILTGAFVNASALTDELAAGGYNSLVVIGCGWEGRRASEDEAAAGAILQRLACRGAELDERARRVVEAYSSRPVGRLRDNRAARRLKRLGYERDLDFCLAEDVVPVVPRLVNGAFAGGI